MTNFTAEQTQAAQEKIHHIQALYRQWLEILPRLEQAYADWQTALAISDELEAFYFDGEYSVLFDALQAGLPVDLTTEGEYSVMSEDALWEAFGEKDRLLWQLLRLSAAKLDRFSDQKTDG